MDGESKQEKDGAMAGLFRRAVLPLRKIRRDSSIGREGDPLGLTTLHQPLERVVADVIFVHGLSGSSKKTWMRDGDPSLFWPQEWLAQDVDFRDVRIHTFGYDANFTKESVLSIHDFAENLLECLRYSTSVPAGEKCPLIFVCHNIGGLVAKRAYIMSQQLQHYHDLCERICAMFFLATPHRGSATTQLLHRILQASNGPSPPPFVADIAPQSAVIESINENFRLHCQALRLFSFYETNPTRIGLTKAIVVPKDSAVLGYPNERRNFLLSVNHKEICKFSDDHDPNYLTVRNGIASVLGEIREMRVVVPMQSLPESQQSSNSAMGQFPEPSPQGEALEAQMVTTPFVQLEAPTNVEGEGKTGGQAQRAPTPDLPGSPKRMTLEGMESNIVIENHLFPVHAFQFSHTEYQSTQIVPFTTVKQLGHGSLGSVDAVLENGNESSPLLARKVIRLSNMARKRLLPLIEQEVAVLRRLQHRHIVRIVRTYETTSAPRQFGILLLPVGDEDLSHYLERVGESDFPKEDLTRLKTWPLCLTSAVAYIHSQNVRHKDIKPSNIICKGDEVLLTDFGSAHQFSAGLTSSTEGYAVGITRMYSAPEVITFDRRGRSADIYSLGCVFAEMFTILGARRVEDFYDFRSEQVPNEPDRTTHVYHATFHKLEAWFAMKNDSWPFSLLSQMMTDDPKSRPTAEGLLVILGRTSAPRRCNCCSFAELRNNVLPETSTLRGSTGSLLSSSQELVASGFLPEEAVYLERHEEVTALMTQFAHQIDITCNSVKSTEDDLSVILDFSKTLNECSSKIDSFENFLVKLQNIPQPSESGANLQIPNGWTPEQTERFEEVLLSTKKNLAVGRQLVIRSSQNCGEPIARNQRNFNSGRLNKRTEGAFSSISPVSGPRFICAPPPSSEGQELPGISPINPLQECEMCFLEHQYESMDAALYHLRAEHFKSSDWPYGLDLWIKEIVPGDQTLDTSIRQMTDPRTAQQAINRSR